MKTSLDLQLLRRDYMLSSLDENSVLENPFEQFQEWFIEAQKAGISDSNAMTLATASKSGIPSARIVLLKEMSERGFMFATNYESQKGQELLSNPHAALLFYWGELERQIRIEGMVEKVSVEESYEYFNSRPRESKIGAWASKQSRVVSGRTEIDEKFNEMKMKYEGEAIPLPEFWGGFLVVPTKFEFWQGRASRLHDRVIFELQQNGEWIIKRLYP